MRKIWILALPLMIFSKFALSSGNELGCIQDGEAQRALVDRTLDSMAFVGNYEFSSDLDALGLISISLTALEIDDRDRLKLVALPLAGATLEVKSQDNQLRNTPIEAAIFHRPSVVKLTYQLNDTGCLLILTQKDPVPPGSKETFHYSHFINNINPYSQITAYIINKETSQNDQRY